MIRITNNKHAGLLPRAKRKESLESWQLRAGDSWYVDRGMPDPEVLAIKVDKEPHKDSNAPACIRTSGWLGDGGRRIPRRHSAA